MFVDQYILMELRYLTSLLFLLLHIFKSVDGYTYENLKINCFFLPFFPCVLHKLLMLA